MLSSVWCSDVFSSDLDRESLARKIASTPLLLFNGAHIVDIDANQPLAEVLALSMAAVATVLAVRGLASARVRTAARVEPNTIQPEQDRKSTRLNSSH